MSVTMVDQDSGDLSGLMLEQADRLFEQEVTIARLAAFDQGASQDDLWRTIEEAGLPLALVAEAQGGIGLPIQATLGLIGRSAYRTVPLPLAETILAGALWAEASGESIGGMISLAAASVGIDSRGDGFVLSGTVAGVPWGAEVGHVLLHGRDQAGDSVLALLPQGAAPAKSRKNLAGEPRATLTLDGVTLSGGQVRPAPAVAAEGLLALGAMIRARQMVGAMERVLEAAVTYAGERRQFGRTLGKFQAIQQMLAEAAGHLAASEAAVALAADAYGREDFAFQAAIAKSRSGEAAGKVAEICHQVHGAMGFTQELPLHFATRRLWSWRDEFGGEPYWQERIGRAVCTAGGEALWPRLVGA